MTEIGDLFTKKLDSSRIGIGGAMSKMMKLIQSKDPPLHKHLVCVCVHVCVCVCVCVCVH